MGRGSHYLKMLSRYGAVLKRSQQKAGNVRLGEQPQQGVSNRPYTSLAGPGTLAHLKASRMLVGRNARGSGHRLSNTRTVYSSIVEAALRKVPTASSTAAVPKPKTLREVLPFTFQSDSNLPSDTTLEQANAAFTNLSQDPLYQFATTTGKKPVGQVRYQAVNDADQAVIQYASLGQREAVAEVQDFMSEDEAMLEYANTN